ncbi:MAG: 6-phosphogluconolactonase [Cytophagaceae bacterium SCN 52-12]|nr:MAG: 6-phosphogluconolactonase [Cytophagaceae bacterium SCN 52-12]
MKLHIAAETSELSSRLAGFLLEDIRSVLDRKDRYTFVLSGGSTPKALYQLLASEPYRSSVPWEKVHFFWGDERFVPFEDPRNNAKMAYEELLNHIPAAAGNIHVMNTSLSPEDSSDHYTGILRSYFGDTGTTFDFVLLGMGDDGHTLSLFPGTPVIHEQEKWVDSFYLDAQSMYRITLTAPVVNRAEKVVFLAAGSNKADVLYQVIEGERNPDLYPSQVIRPIYGELHWFVDAQAAAKL